MSKKKVYLKKVSLSGYRTIIDTQIELNSGLNIIIGKNSSGKTSFLDFLNASLKFNLTETFSNCKSDVTIISENELRIIQENQTQEISDNAFIETTNESYFVDGIPYTPEEKYHPTIFFAEKKSYFFVKHIKHGIPEQIYSWTLSEDIAITITPNNKVTRPLIPLISAIIRGRVVPFFLGSAISKAVFNLTNLNEIEDGFRSIIQEYCLAYSNKLKIFSSIKSIKLSENFSITFNQSNGELIISNLFFLFYSNDSWLSYNQLSDGSKRVAYIISEFITGTNSSENSIYLIEEPELGIHPHQLHKLALFLKEESFNKQIILTTHNPQTLNILDENELGSIILCNYSKSTGTTLNHLTEKQKVKATAYMKEVGYLSMYWLHSDLETDE
ncbi:MAG: ATP-dependent nuclease [Bacteroidota bacterium]|jgi:predicted ATP-dependent endonuclease of OLD family